VSDSNKKNVWKEPDDKTQWLLDLIDLGESVVIGYEKFLLNQLSHKELARVMTAFRDLLPMSKEK